MVNPDPIEQATKILQRLLLHLDRASDRCEMSCKRERLALDAGLNKQPTEPHWIRPKLVAMGRELLQLRDVVDQLRDDREAAQVTTEEYNRLFPT